MRRDRIQVAADGDEIELPARSDCSAPERAPSDRHQQSACDTPSDRAVVEPERLQLAPADVAMLRGDQPGHRRFHREFHRTMVPTTPDTQDSRPPTGWSLF